LTIFLILHTQIVNAPRMIVRMTPGNTIPSLLVIIILFCFNAASTAQNNRFQFKGRVLDRETNLPVSGVNLSVAGTRRGCSSNLNGEFSMTVYTRPAFINVSHLGYESQKIWLDSATNTITLLMNPVRQLLQEVEIRAVNKPIPFFKDDKYSVLDYEVDSNMIYLLIYRFRLNKSEILCKSLEGDTLSRSGIIPFKPSGLFLDCLHNLHVLTEDSTYQLVRRKDSIFLCYPSDIKMFRAFLSDCVTSTDSMLFFRKESPDQLSVEFFQVNRNSKKKQLLAAMGDEAKLKMLRENPEVYQYLIMREPPRNEMTEDGNIVMGDVVGWQWLKKIVFTANTSSLHRIDDVLGVFNTTKYTLDLYTMNGLFFSKLKMPVEDINEGRWTTEIYVDNIDHNAYTSFLTMGGYFTLYQINLNTGELKRILSAEQGFPQKVRIHRHFLFYLYDIPGEGDNKYLFRQKL